MAVRASEEMREADSAYKVSTLELIYGCLLSPFCIPQVGNILHSAGTTQCLRSSRTACGEKLCVGYTTVKDLEEENHIPWKSEEDYYSRSRYYARGT